MSTWLRELPDHLILTVHVQPGARRTEVVGTHGDALKIRLAAPAVEGKANAALIAFLAAAFGVPKRGIEILAGDSSRSKRVRVQSPRRRPDREWAQG
ncbi:MAG: YggU family protein [Flavobacteriales bacterium]|nr:YggU family protein [Flavobacteriales bacterium]